MRNINSRKLHAGLVALAAFSSVLITSCSSEGIIDPVSKDKVALQLKASIGDASSRSVSTNKRETAFEVGDEILIPIGRKSSSGYDLITTSVYSVSDSNGTLGSLNPFYLEESDTVHIAGLYPANKYTITSLINNTINFTVESDQSSDAGYEKSDAIIADLKEVSFESPSTSLVFKHMMSKIKMTLSSNYYTEQELQSAVVTLKDIQPTMGFPPVAYIFKVNGSAGGTATDIIAKTSDNTQTTFCCIIPPQVIKPGNLFFQITIGADSFTAALDSNNAVGFSSSNVYAYNLHIDRTQMTVTSASITGWNPINTTPTDIYLKN